MNTIPIYSQFILTIPKAVTLGMLIGLSLILIPGTSDSDGNIFNPYNVILLILGSWGVSCIAIRILYDTQKLTKLSFVISLAMRDYHYRHHLSTLLIVFAVYKFADVLFLNMGLGINQLVRDALFFFLFIVCFEVLREWLKTRRSQ